MEATTERVTKLRVYSDLISQPARAVLIFCRMNNIDFDLREINLAKREHRSAEFKDINPMCQVPAIQDGGFKLFESHAILKYLACSHPGVPDHWYPADLNKRAKIDSVLDWHHSNLRKGSSRISESFDGLVYNIFLAPLFNRPINLSAASEAEKILRKSLSMLDTFWLSGSGKFLVNSLQPSIADLSLACEVMQLQLLDTSFAADLLDRRENVKKWMDAVQEKIAPHFQEVHESLLNLAESIRSERSQKQVSTATSKL